MSRIPRSSPHPCFAKVTCVPTILPVHPSVECERYVLPNELLALQGWPINASPIDLGEYSSSTKCSLAGNMFTGSVCMAVLVSAFCAVKWADSEPGFEEESEAIAAMSFARTLQ